MDTVRSIQSGLIAFTERGWLTEIIVCNNNSTDRTAELARNLGVRVIFEPVNQISRARNTGAAAATGQWLLFVDADSRPSRELFADVLAAMERGECVAGGATVRLDGHYPVASLIVSAWNAVSRLRRWMAGSFIFCEATAFREAGGFSQELFAGEELELSEKLKELARKRRKRVVILHRHPIATSARKIHLYSAWEHFRFLAWTALVAGRTLRNRESCPTWYDGRR